MTVRGEGAPREIGLAGCLLIPVRSADGELTSLQVIRRDGTKIFLQDGKVEGGHFALGNPASEKGPILLGEGYATGATLRETTRFSVVVAFNAGNLEPVAAALRERYPDRQIIVAGDDDRQRALETDLQGRKKLNVGRVKAEAAAAAVGGTATFPRFAGPNGTDWNDLARQEGKEAAATQLRAAIAPIAKPAEAREATASPDAAAAAYWRGLYATAADTPSPKQELVAKQPRAVA